MVNRIHVYIIYNNLDRGHLTISLNIQGTVALVTGSNHWTLKFIWFHVCEVVFYYQCCLCAGTVQNCIVEVKANAGTSFRSSSAYIERLYVDFDVEIPISVFRTIWMMS